LFRAQAVLAKTLRLPLIVHSREAFGDTLGLVKDFAGSIDIVIHCFGYGAREARAFLDLGCSLSFAGNISYKKSDDLREALARTPLDMLLLETDSPYMNPMPMRGKPSTPMDLGRTIALASELIRIDVEELALLVHRNALRIFGGIAPV
jgi:TatD DNase family protein